MQKNLHSHLIYINVIISLLLSAFMTFSIYPYIFTADGGTRINTAWNIFHNQVITQNVMTHTQTIFMYLCYSMTNNFATYTFFQSFMMIFSLSMLLKSLMNHYMYDNKKIVYLWFVVSIVFISFPVTLVFSTILTDSSGVIIGMSLVTVLIFGKVKPTKINLSLYLLALLTCFIFLFGYRTNSLILVPIVILFIVYFRNIPKARKIIEATALIFAILVVTAIVPNIVKQKHVHPESLSFAWELIGIAKDDDIGKYDNILDFVGDTKEAIKRYNSSYLNPIFWDEKPPMPAIEIIESTDVSKRIRNLYIKTAINSPIDFLKHKIKVILLVSGIKEPLLDVRRGIHFVDENSIKFGAINTEQNVFVRETFFKWVEKVLVFTLRPYIMFLFATVMLLAIYKLNKENFTIWLFVYLISNVYYFGFFLNTQAMEFRYYAPTFFTLAALSVSSITILLDKILCVLITKLKSVCNKTSDL